MSKSTKKSNKKAIQKTTATLVNDITDNAITNNNTDLQGIYITAKELSDMLSGNYRTVRKILEEMAEAGAIKTGSVIRARKEVVAFALDNSTIRSIHSRLKQIRENRKTLAEQKHKNTDKVSANVVTTDIMPDNAQIQNNSANDTANVKFFEVLQKNVELEKALNEAEKELVKAENEKVMLKADLTVSNNTLKFIEDKQKTFEVENARLSQEIETEKENFKKSVRKLNIIIIILSAIILIAVTVKLTLLFALQSL